MEGETFGWPGMQARVKLFLVTPASASRTFASAAFTCLLAPSAERDVTW